MGDMSRVTRWVDRRAPLCLTLAAVAFPAFWLAQAHGQEDLWGPLSAPLRVLVFVLLAVGLTGHQLVQDTHPGAWVGWAATAAVLQGVAGSLTLAGLGLAAFGVSVLRCGVHRRTPGVLLAVGGAASWVLVLLTPGFGFDHSSDTPLVWRFALGIALILVAGALADLGADSRERVTADIGRQGVTGRA